MEKQPIGIIGAMEMEVQTLIQAMEETGREGLAGLVFHSGTLEGVPCVVVQCGAGKVNAAACAQALIQRFAPRLVINVGVAGGVGKEVRIGDLVAASACVQYDYDTTAIGEPAATLTMRRLEGEPELVREFPCDRAAAALLLEEARSVYGGAHLGVIATGDAFVADGEKNRALGEAYSAKAVEMEGGSIAQVCYMNRVPCAVLRAISDNADDTAHMDFPEFARSSSEKSAELLRRTLAKL